MGCPESFLDGVFKGISARSSHGNEEFLVHSLGWAPLGFFLGWKGLFWPEFHGAGKEDLGSLRILGFPGVFAPVPPLGSGAPGDPGHPWERGAARGRDWDAIKASPNPNPTSPIPWGIPRLHKSAAIPGLSRALLSGSSPS